MALDRYLPFGGGPRKCLGDMFATFEVHNPAPVGHISCHLRLYLIEACEMSISWFPFRGFEILLSTCCIFEGFGEFKGESTLTSVITRLCGRRLFKISPLIWRHEVRGVRSGNVWGCSNKVEAFYILKMSLVFFISVEMKNQVVDNFDQLLCCAFFADGDCISHAYTTI